MDPAAVELGRVRGGQVLSLLPGGSLSRSQRVGPGQGRSAKLEPAEWIRAATIQISGFPLVQLKGTLCPLCLADFPL